VTRLSGTVQPNPGYTPVVDDAGGLGELTQVDRRGARHAAETLSRAFADYPMIRHYFPDEAEARALAMHFFHMGVASGVRLGEVYAASPAMEGVAVWFPPGGYPPSFLSRLVSVPFRSLLGFLFSGGAAMRLVREHFDRRHSELMQRTHWYLETLGVDPAYQGKVYSSRLVRAMYPRADAQSLPT
jgi:ribosomal protein S18 acetylase RimI-like enzyme